MSEKGSSPALVGPCVNKEPAGSGVPFPGREQETKLTFILTANPSFIRFSFCSPAIKKQRCLKRDVCRGNHPLVSGRVWGFVTPGRVFAVEIWVQWRPPPAGSGGTFVHNRLRTLHVPLAPFLTRVG